MVVYRSKMTHGKNKRNFTISTADEFMADITQYIPEKSFQLVRYYGRYFNRMRGERRKLEEGGCDVEHEKEVAEISGVFLWKASDLCLLPSTLQGIVVPEERKIHLAVLIPAHCEALIEWLGACFLLGTFPTESEFLSL